MKEIDNTINSDNTIKTINLRESSIQDLFFHKKDKYNFIYYYFIVKIK
jgi:hypothetical protein